MFEEPKNKENNIFDPEEDDEVTFEDIKLAEMGIIPGKMDLFRKQYPNKRVFYNDNLTKQAFEYYLERIDQKELEAIQEDRLPENLQEIYRTKFSEGVESVIDKTKSLIEQYIEKNKELIQDNAKVHEENYKLLEMNDNLIENIQFLYDLLGKMLSLINEENLPFPFTPEELETIKTIKEMIKE